MSRVELSRAALKDLARLEAHRGQVEKVLLSLAEEPPRANLDVKALSGRPPWRRLRAGVYRVIFRPLTPAEIRQLVPAGGRAYLVARIVHRRELEKVVATL